MMISIAILFSLTTLSSDPQQPSLGDYFGFSSLESIKIGDDAGPLYEGDVNNDGLIDLLVINNHKSRIDILLQKRNASPDDVIEISRANEIPEHWRFDKQQVMVSNKVSGLTLYDFNNDGLTDIVYASNPSKIVFLEQKPDGSFERSRQHRVRKLHANRSGFVITDLMGDSQPELVTLIDGNIQVFPVDGDALGKPITFTTADRITWFALDDYDGNGLDDIAGIVRDSSEPVRLCLAQHDGDEIRIGPQLRLEMTPLRECRAVSLPKSQASIMTMIERTSKRFVVY
ncbi:VCBS repeat-containing protein [PVC group bacterium]|nr:VCBS repeat-containing protein [PVC group bacterium]